MAEELERVEFEFAGGTLVTFQRSSERWISWTARVSTAAERLQFRREKRAGRPGIRFYDEFLQPTLIHAQRLIKRAAAQRIEERDLERAGRAKQPA